MGKSRRYWLAVGVAAALTHAVIVARVVAMGKLHGDLSPFYMQWGPRFSPWGLAAPVLFALLLIVWPRLARTRGWVFCPAATFIFGALALACAAAWGGPGNIPARALGVFLKDLGALGDHNFFGGYPGMLPALSDHGHVRPPGLFLALWVAVRLVGENRHVLEILWTAVATAAAFPIYALARRYAAAEVAALGVALYLLSTNFISHGVSYDGMFATLGLTLIYLLVRAAEEDGWGWTTAAGVALAAAAFFSFTLAFLAVLAVVLVGFHGLKTKKPANAAAKLAVIFGLPAVFLLALHAVTGYDWRANFVESYRWAQTQASGGMNVFKLIRPHENPAGYPEPSFRRSYWLWMPSNFIVLLLAAGAPTAVLFVRWLWSLRRRPEREAPFGATFGLAFAALVLFNLTGVTLGETERLWLYILPLITIPAAATLVRLRDEAGDAAVVRASLAVVFAQAFAWRIVFWFPW